MATQGEKKEIKKWEQIIKKLKKKYGMGFNQFEKQLGKKLNLNWEHERDYIDWDWALTNIKKI